MIRKIAMDLFDVKPTSIIQALDLRKPIYKQTAAYGHFGHPDLNLMEKVDRVNSLKQISESRVAVV